MAKKKKRKKRAPSSPAGTPDQPASNRAARKEAARRERERAIRAYKRRRLLRRSLIGGLVLALVAGGGVLIWSNVRQSSQAREEINALAEQVGCGDVEQADGPDGTQFDHVEQPPQYETTPASYGPHFTGTLDPGVSVYDVPFDPAFEFRAVHNLEHGYVIMYYRQEGESALPENVLTRLTDLAERENEVILAPHPTLADDENLVLVAWNRIRRCDVTGEAGTVQDVAEGFIEEFRDGPAAPEPAAG